MAESVKKGFPADLVEAAKKTRRMKAELKKNSVLGLAQAWSDALALEGRTSPDEAVGAIEALSVEDVNRVAKKYLDLDRSFVDGPYPRVLGQGRPGTERPEGRILHPCPRKACETPIWAEKASNGWKYRSPP